MKNFGIYLILLSVFILAACGKDPETYTTVHTDTFVVDSEDDYQQANKILQADYMFVIDESASMDFNSGNPSDVNASKREEFMNGLATFINTLRSTSVDYRIGFISGNVQKGRVSDLTGRGFYDNILINSIMSVSQQSGLVSSLQSIGQTLNANTNVMLESADEVMSNEQSTFVREGSQLIYLFVSDSDDESASYITSHATSTADYAARLIAHKGTAQNIPAFVNARAIVAGVNTSCDPSDDFSESTGTRLAETAQIIENTNRSIAGLPANATAASVSHCILRASTEFPTLLDQLARDVSKPTNLFKLQVSNVDPDTIHVFIDNGSGYTEVPTSGFVYLSATNAVKLSTTPASSAKVKLTYNQFYRLSGTPADLSSLAVSVNGSDIQLSDTNGWSYVTADNRIVFHNVTIPNHTTIEITYK